MAEEPLTVANEFTAVEVRTRRTRNGERLEIASPRLGRSILLDPLELEALTWATPETFAALLRTPYGPEDAPGARPLSDLL